jgi:hypothetical protein
MPVPRVCWNPYGRQARTHACCSRQLSTPPGCKVSPQMAGQSRLDQSSKAHPNAIRTEQPTGGGQGLLLCLAGTFTPTAKLNCGTASFIWNSVSGYADECCTESRHTRPGSAWRLPPAQWRAVRVECEYCSAQARGAAPTRCSTGSRHCSVVGNVVWGTGGERACAPACQRKLQHPCRGAGKSCAQHQHQHTPRTARSDSRTVHSTRYCVAVRYTVHGTRYTVHGTARQPSPPRWDGIWVSGYHIGYLGIWVSHWVSIQPASRW